jgi:hypothetical protein
VEDTNVPDGNALTNKVKINLNMLGALVLNRVGGEIDGADVVVVDCASPHAAVKANTPLATARYSASALEWETTF